MPTRTQFKVELQLIELIAVDELTSDWFEVHAVPLVDVRTGVGAPLNAEPAVTQPDVEHEITSVVAEPWGIVTCCHVAPPSVVTTP
jgi:hypothetical protein